MAKRDFSQDSQRPVTSAFLNSIYLTGGGHRHDGGAEDGSCDKVVLNNGAEVVGLLPNSNQIPPLGYKHGMQLNYVDSTSITINPGVCCSSDGTTSISTLQSFTKSLNSVFAVGSLVGGRAAAISLTNATWYHLFAIASAAGSIDFYYDTSTTAANIPTGYSKWRLIGSVYYDSGIRNFRQIGKFFYWMVPVYSVSSSGVPAYPSVITHTIHVPPRGVIAIIESRGNSSDTSGGWRVRISGDTIANDGGFCFGSTTQSSVFNVFSNAHLPCSTSEIKIRRDFSHSDTLSIDVITVGWIDELI